MKGSIKRIKWPNGKVSKALAGENWLEIARSAGVTIPTGCLTGSCGACEIEVNGEVVRACISPIPESSNEEINIDFFSDPYW